MIKCFGGLAGVHWLIITSLCTNNCQAEFEVSVSFFLKNKTCLVNIDRSS